MVLLGVCDVITRAHMFSVVLLGVCDAHYKGTHVLWFCLVFVMLITRAHMFSVVLLGVCDAHYKGTHVLCGFAWCL